MTRVQIINEAVFSSNNANTFWKSMHLTISAHAIDKIVVQTGLYHLAMATGHGERKL